MIRQISILVLGVFLITIQARAEEGDERQDIQNTVCFQMYRARAKQNSKERTSYREAAIGVAIAGLPAFLIHPLLGLGCEATAVGLAIKGQVAKVKSKQPEKVVLRTSEAIDLGETCTADFSKKTEKFLSRIKKAVPEKRFRRIFHSEITERIQRGYRDNIFCNKTPFEPWTENEVIQWIASDLRIKLEAEKKLDVQVDKGKKRKLGGKYVPNAILPTR